MRKGPLQKAGFFLPINENKPSESLGPMVPLHLIMEWFKICLGK
jgi:hypothetical protein